MTLSFSEQITNDSHKQHLNLTEFAWNIIENDMVDFFPVPVPRYVSRF